MPRQNGVICSFNPAFSKNAISITAGIQGKFPNNMNSENFHEYLKNPSMLHQISYQELKSLVLQYPYSPNLRYLLMLKSLMDGNKEHDRNLTLASLFSLDRKKLFELVQQHGKMQAMQENYALTEDFLELKDLSTIESLLEEQSSMDHGQASAMRLENETGSFDVESLSPLADKSAHDFGESDDMDFQLLENLFVEQTPAEEITSSSETEESDLPSGLPGNATQVTEEPPSLEEILIELTENHRPLQTENDVWPASESELQESPESPEESEIPDLQGEGFDLEDTLLRNELQEIQEGQLEFETDILPENIEMNVGDAPETNEPPGGNLSDLDDAEPAKTSSAAAQNIPFEIVDNLSDPTDQVGSSMIQPAPKTSFNSWLQQFTPPQAGLFRQPLPPPISKIKESMQEPPPFADPQYLAQNSLSEDTGIASETLAEILEKQGHYKKAMAMYEQLRLQHPEKSAFFAAKIEKLMKK